MWEAAESKREEALTSACHAAPGILLGGPHSTTRAFHSALKIGELARAFRGPTMTGSPQLLCSAPGALHKGVAVACCALVGALRMETYPCAPIVLLN